MQIGDVKAHQTPKGPQRRRHLNHRHVTLIPSAHGAKTPARNSGSRGLLISRLELVVNHAQYANGQLLPCQSGAEATVAQTLRAGRTLSNLPKRLDCGAFTAAFILTWDRG
jgi:hypothetical protein